ncbi:MAG: putative Ig domain-containing protein [Myxococcota bacterium]
MRYGWSVVLVVLIVLMVLVGCGDGEEGTSPATNNGSSDGVTSNTTAGGTTSSNGSSTGTTSNGGGTAATSSGGTTQPNTTNRAPVLDKIGSKRARMGRELVFDVTASDPDDDRLNFSVFGELPQGAKFDKGTQQFSWTPGQEQLGDVTILTFAVTDGDLEDRETVQMTVVDGDDNSAPELTNPGDQLVVAGMTLELQLEATDPDGDMLRYSIDGPAPPDSSLNEETGLFVWTPRVGDQGANLRVLFVASDGQAQDDALVRLVVSELELSLGDIDAQQVRLGEELRLPLPIDNPAGLEVSCSTIGLLPASATFDTEACTLIWTPADVELVGQSVELGFQVRAEEDGEPVTLVTTVTIAILAPLSMDDTCVADPLEPNDFIEDATVVGTALAEQGLTHCNEDWDVFRVELAQGQQLEAWLLFAHAQKDLDMDVYLGDATTPLATSWSLTDDEQLTLEAPVDGFYYVEVFSLQEGQAEYDIALNIQDGPQCMDDDAEPNDTAEAATLITDGFGASAIICPNNPDRYAIVLEQGQPLRVTIVFEETVDLDLWVLSPSGQRWTSAGVLEVEEVIIPSSDAAGTWQIEVYGFEGASGEYLMEVVAP